jgi:hypothetical protein
MKVAERNIDQMESKIRYYIKEINYLTNRSERERKQGLKFRGQLSELMEQYEILDDASESLIELGWSKVLTASEKFKN